MKRISRIYMVVITLLFVVQISAQPTEVSPIFFQPLDSFLSTSGNQATSFDTRPYFPVSRPNLDRIGEGTPESRMKDVNGDGIPDFAQLNSKTREALRLTSPKRSELTRGGAPIQFITESSKPQNADSTGTNDLRDSNLAVPVLGRFFQWEIQESNPLHDERNRASNPSPSLSPEMSDMRPTLSLDFDREKSTSTQRAFRISVSGIQSANQPVIVWVSNDLRNWSKVDDDAIKTDERGERKILMPLNSRIQFFRVSLGE